MTFNELTRAMLNNMDFFELRRTAARYAVPYQGVRRQKLIRDLEIKILSKGTKSKAQKLDAETLASTSPQGATSAKPKSAEAKKSEKPKTPVGIRTFSTRAGFFNRMPTTR